MAKKKKKKARAKEARTASERKQLERKAKRLGVPVESLPKKVPHTAKAKYNK